MRQRLEGTLVSYDMTNDARRTAVGHRLERVGVRHLYSSFWLPPLRPAALNHLLDDIDAEFRAGDKLIAVPTCKRCLLLSSGRPLEQLHPEGQVL